MAADGGRLRTTQATQACAVCKTRKKKCNKSLPSCGYCTRKGLDCVYALVPCSRNHAAPTKENAHAAPSWGARPPKEIGWSRMILSAKSSSDQTTAEVHQSQVYVEVHSIIRATGQFVEDISARYFHGFHRHLPIISRTIFYNNLITLGAAPAADFSVLLLTICLITHVPALGYQCGHGVAQSPGPQSLYFNAKSIFAQVQVSCPLSVPLIQAGILLAVYEYTHGRPDDAFVTITGSVRMAYAARIHAYDRHQKRTINTESNFADIDLLLQAEEKANLWWGIVICERLFFAEGSVFDQPLLTVFPRGDARLPIEPQVFDQLDILDPQCLSNIPLSCLTSPKVGGFSRTAQATCLLDQIFKGFDTPDIDSRLLYLDRLDINTQAFLTLIMPQCEGQSGRFCAAVNIAIRALFTLHWHILDQHPQVVNANFKPLKEWQKRSQEALDTVTKMVVDIAECLIAASSTSEPTSTIDAMPPTYQYIARAALRHIQSSSSSSSGSSSAERKDVGWHRSAQDVLHTSLDLYYRRWSLSDDQARLKLEALEVNAA